MAVTVLELASEFCTGGPHMKQVRLTPVHSAGILRAMANSACQSMSLTGVSVGSVTAMAALYERQSPWTPTLRTGSS